MFLLGSFHSCTRRSPFLEFRRRNESSWFDVGRAPATGLPPVVVILADHLQNITNYELDARLLAWNQLIPSWIVIKQCPNEYLSSKQCEVSCK